MSNFGSSNTGITIAIRMTLLVTAALAASSGIAIPASAADRPLDYRVLATLRTSTMEKELNESAAAGYRFTQAMGGKSANGGQEIVVAMVKDSAPSHQVVRRYRLLATTKTSTMQKSYREGGAQGYVLLGSPLVKPN